MNKPVPQNFRPRPIKKKHYVLGQSGLVIESLMPGGHGWGDWLPLGETQLKNGIDPASCPAGGTLNCIEAIGKKKYGASFQNDLSERYLAIIMGMNGHGGDPHMAAEVIRNGAGAIPEAFLPFNNSITTIQKYFSPRPISYSLFKIGYHWTLKYDFKHEWLFNGGTLLQKQQALRQALISSPIGVSGYAWSQHPDGKYYKDGPDTHWFIVYDYVPGEYWLAFDTYEPYVKKLDWNYDFGYAKRYSLNRKVGAENVSDNPQDCYIPYVFYLVKWFISNLTQ